MQSEIYETFNELAEKRFQVEGDPELGYLHQRATKHLEDAIFYDNLDDRRNYERNLEVRIAKRYLEYFDSVKSQLDKNMPNMLEE